MNAGDISINLRLDDKDFSVTVKNSGRLLRELRQDLLKVSGVAETAEHRFHSFSGHFKSFMMTIAATRFALMDIHQVFLALPQSIAKASGDIERMQKLMAGLSKETNELKRNQEGISDAKFVFGLAKNAPFEVKALSDAFVKLKTAGLDPTNGSLQTLVDSVARFGGTSEHLHRASIAIQQMTGKGVISMEELRQQLGEAVPTAMKAMATGVGMSMGQLVDKISKGTVESRSALERMFAVLKVENDGAALRMMDSYVGQLERLKTNWTLFANEVGTSGGFFAEIKNQLTLLNDAFADPQVRQFAHELSVALGDVVKGIASLVSSAIKYSDEIATAGRAILAVWVGSKMIAAFSGIMAAYKVFIDKYVGGVQAIIAAEGERAMVTNAAAASEIATQRRRILANAQANAETIRSNAAAAGVELAQGRAKHATLMAEHEAYYAKFLAADKIATSKRLADGKFANAQEIANQRALATAYFERAMAAERMAVKIKASEVALVATSTGAMAAMRANTAAAAAELATVGAAATASASKLGILRGAIGLLGGPIGIITTLLTAGVWAWFEWGRAGEEAAERAREALRRVKDGYASLEDAQRIQTRIKELNTQISEKESSLKNPAINMLPDPKKMRDEINAGIAALKEERARYNAQLAEATRQGNESAIQSTVRIVEERAEREIRAGKSAASKVINAEIDELDKRLETGKIKREQYDKERSALVRKLAVQGAEKEIAAYKAQRETIKAAMAAIDAGEVAGVNKSSPKYAGYERQLAAMNEKLRQSQSALTSAEKIGTAPEFVSKGKEGKQSAAEKYLQNVHETLARINAELDKKGSGTIADLISGAQSLLNRGKISPEEFNQIAVAIGNVSEARDKLTLDKSIEKYGQQMEDAIAGIEGKLEHTTTGIGKMREHIAELLKSSIISPEQMKEIEKLQETLKHWEVMQKKLDDQESEKRGKGISKTLAEQAATFRAAMQPESEALVTNYAKDVESMLRTIDAANLGPDQAKKVWADFFDWLQERQKKLVRDSETPLQQLSRQWEDVTKQLRDASTRWANQTVDAIVQFAKTGKLEWRGLVDSILTDILRIQVQRTMGKAINGVIDKGIEAIGGVFKAGMSSGDSSKGEKQAGQSSWWDEMVGGVKKFMGSIFGAGDAANDLAKEGVTAAAQTAKGVIQDGLKMTSETNATVALDALATAAYNAASALGGTSAGGLTGGLGGLGGMFSGLFGGGGGWGDYAASAGDSVGVAGDIMETMMFANGGIMTEFGPVALRKYANGGIANNPQLAMFGEGSMPEAYVPLPDGRSIPVSFEGGMMGGNVSNVSINIIVNEAEGGGDKSSAFGQGDKQGFWKDVAERVKGMVRQEMVEQQRPGGVLYRLA